MANCTHGSTTLRMSTKKQGDKTVTITSTICNDCHTVLDVLTEVD